MKKLLIILVFLFFICGCKSNNSASNVVKSYLNSFKDVDIDVEKEIDRVIYKSDDLSLDQKKLYKKIFIKQYKSIDYDIMSEEYDHDKALIRVNINVYDLNKAEENALQYLSEHLSEFYDENNIFDNDKYILYKLNLMYETKDRVDYEIVFFLKEKNNNWILEQPTESDLEKIHGIYKN